MPSRQQPLPLSSSAEVSATDIARAWTREMPGVDVDSILVITTLWRAAKVLAAERSRTLRGLGVDAATLDLLSTLRRAGAPYRLTTQELAQRCLVTAGAISQRLNRAEAEGLVTRESAGNGRKGVAVTLTEKGHHFLDPAVTELFEHESTLVSVLDEEERAHLVEMLDRLSRHVEDHRG